MIFIYGTEEDDRGPTPKVEETFARIDFIKNRLGKNRDKLDTFKERYEFSETLFDTFP